MPTFAYQAADATGKSVSGTLDAPDRASAVRSLSGKGLKPFKVAESGAKAGPNGKAATSKTKAKAGGKEDVDPGGPIRLGSNQLQLFTEELAELLEAGMRLEPALKLMEGRGSSVSPHKRIAQRLGDLIREGHPFSSALRAASPSFGELFCAVAAAGEAGGSLAEAMKRQAAYLANAREMRSQVAVALIYPSFLLVSAIFVTVLFTTFLIPRLTTLITSIRGSIPIGIQVLMSTTDFVKQWWWLLLIVAVVIGVFSWMWASSEGGRPIWDKAKTRLPFLGGILMAGFHTQFLETLASLTGGGLPLLRALELASRISTNTFIQSKLANSIDAVRDGAALSRSLEKTSLFPGNLIEMVRLGEHTGDLSGTLRRTADRCGRELGKKLEKVVALMQPVIILLMACLVGVMAYLMISVIFQTVSILRDR
jgi:type II secretory pathway component PulF